MELLKEGLQFLVALYVLRLFRRSVQLPATPKYSETVYISHTASIRKVKTEN
jgi:hypothetical protein